MQQRDSSVSQVARCAINGFVTTQSKVKIFVHQDQDLHLDIRTTPGYSGLRGPGIRPQPRVFGNRGLENIRATVMNRRYSRIVVPRLPLLTCRPADPWFLGGQFNSAAMFDIEEFSIKVYCRFQFLFTFLFVCNIPNAYVKCYIQHTCVNLKIVFMLLPIIFLCSLDYQQYYKG